MSAESVTGLSESTLDSGVNGSYAELRERLFSSGILYATGIEGVYGRSDTYQRICDAVSRMVSRWATTLHAEVIHFPPVVARSTFDHTNYLQSFPDLMGSVHIFRGSDREHAELLRRVENDGNWPELLEPAEIVLASAACHSLYPLCSGTLPEGGRWFEVRGYCFRHEPSVDPARMQAFTMHEVVYVGDPDQAQRHRDTGLGRGLHLLRKLGLEMDAVQANDPFFGRLGASLAAGQMQEGLKIEGVTPICDVENPTAIMSANCHRDHFGHPFEIKTASGGVAHSACVAFGIDRIALALLAEHGLEPPRWPSQVRQRLWP